MSFDFGKFLKGVRETNTFKLALELAFKKAGEAIDKNAHDPAAVKKIAGSLINDSGPIVDAVLQNTEAEHLGAPEAGGTKAT